MKDPVTTITGILKMIFLILASFNLDWFGIEWSDETLTNQIILIFTGIMDGIVNLILIFKAKD